MVPADGFPVLVLVDPAPAALGGARKELGRSINFYCHPVTGWIPGLQQLPYAPLAMVELRLVHLDGGACFARTLKAVLWPRQRALSM